MLFRSAEQDRELRRKIANRESARRSREAIDGAIIAAERAIQEEHAIHAALESELAMLQRFVSYGYAASVAATSVEAEDTVLVELLNDQDSIDDWDSSACCDSNSLEDVTKPHDILDDDHSVEEMVMQLLADGSW